MRCVRVLQPEGARFVWIPLSDERRIKRSFSILRKQLTDGAEKFPRQWIGSPGGRQRVDTYLHRKDGFWAAMPPRRSDCPYFCCLVGATDPRLHPGLDIDVEINLPATGLNRRYAGAFVTDEAGQLYVAHSGKIGGGHAGIGKSTFRASYHSGNWQTVRWPDGKANEMIVLAPIRDPRLVPAIAHFVAEVSRFKHGMRSPSVADFASATGVSGEVADVAEPVPTDEAEAACWRAVVVGALADVLRNRALDHRIECRRSMVAMRSTARAWLFAVATEDIAAAVGELMLVAGRDNDTTLRIVVVPAATARTHGPRLRSLGLGFVGYEWRNARPVFDGLDAVL